MRNASPTNIPYHIRLWAQYTWNSWTVREKAEFASAIDSVLRKNQGEGDGTPAPKRRNSNERNWSRD
jgi:hypothetical protein